MTLQLDHLILLVHDLEATLRGLRERLGEVTEHTFRNEQWGTENTLLFLSDNALEVMAVVDEAAAAKDMLGQHLQRQLASGDRLASLCLRSDDLDAHAARLGIGTMPVAEIGDTYAGFVEGLFNPGLPFFVAREARPAGDAPRLDWVEVAVSDPARLERWLDDGAGPVDVRRVEGASGVRRAGLRTAAGELVLQDGVPNLLAEPQPAG